MKTFFYEIFDVIYYIIIIIFWERRIDAMIEQFLVRFPFH